MSALKAGPMPGIDLGYEDFEQLLARIYSAVIPHQEESPKLCLEIIGILVGFSARYQVQAPEEAAGHPREPLKKWKPVAPLSAFEAFQLTPFFWSDFHIGGSSFLWVNRSSPVVIYTDDRYEVYRLGLCLAHLSRPGH